METRLARFLSVIFHPLLMPVLGFAILFYSDNYVATFLVPSVKTVLLGIVFMFTCLLPVLNALLLLRLKRINSLSMHTREERLIPYASTALYYLALYLLFYFENFPVVFQLLVLGAFLCIVITLLVTLRWKISAHMTGIGGMAGAILALTFRLQTDFSLIFLVIIICAGLAGYARLRLQAHEPAQVYTGFTCGFLVQFLLLALCP